VPHTPRRTLSIGRLLLAGVLALAFASVGEPALADTADDPDAIRWSVTPADESGPDGRRAIEVELDPGEAAEDLFAVRNVSDVEVTFRLTAADGFYTRNGRFDILPSDQESVDAGTWISLPEEVTVAAGGTVVVPFQIDVPDDAEPGDHAAGITASVLSTQTSDDGASVGVESRVGFRVTTRVTGELRPEAVVHGLVGGYATSWNPLRPGELTVGFDVENTGNTILLVEGAVAAGGRSGEFPGVDENPQELLPGDSRRFEVVVQDVWPLFVLPTEVVVTPTMLTMTGDTSQIEPVTASTTVWAVPWPQLLLIAGIALIILALVWGRRRSKRRLRTMLEQAREEGRRDATDTSETP